LPHPKSVTVMTVFFVIPIATIAAIVFFSLLVAMLWARHRRRDGPVFVPPRNHLMPMQPMTVYNNVNPLNPPITQPTPLGYPYNPQPLNPYVENPQPFNPYYANPQPVPSAPITVPNQVAHPMPIPQPFSPAPINPSTTPQNPATSSELMDRMRQVQMLMVDIHRLESEGNHQRVQELKQRVAELSGTDSPPPAYLPDVNRSIGKQEYGRG